ncbi:odorant receptor Or2-like isoform X1 [Polyergus mexicanus]|uniref:odorant receptor Or2-like isoform X1 n=1 Tax=Polyergus mexicanus TaxID=615972 RepID=UPI0038B48671
MDSKIDSTILDGTVSRSIEIGLRVIGVWPDSSYAFLRRAFWMITLTIAQTFQYRYFVAHVRTEDLSHLMDGLSTTMSYSLLLLKLTIFWINRRIFHGILTIMARDRSECASDWAACSMSRMIYVSHRSSNLIIGLYSMSVFLYGTGVLVAHADEIDDEGDDVQLAVPARELFLKMELPFESNASPVYEIVMVTQFFHQLAAATIVGVLNALIVSLILHVGGQIDIMCRGLVEISSDIDAFDLRTTTVKALIHRHQRIIALSADIETLFSYIALMQFLWNTLVICCLGFLIVTIFQYRYAIVHFGQEDLTLLMDALSVTFAYTLLLIKMIIFALNTRLLNEIIVRMVKDWEECDILDRYTMIRMAYISRRFSNIIIFSHTISVFFYATGALLKQKGDNQTDARELIVKMELPFEVERTPIYVTVLITQFLHQSSAAAMVGVLNSFLITLVLHACGQIDIVRQKFSEITQKSVTEGIMKTLIVRHQRIIVFSKNIEALFSNIALIQFVSNTLVICCLGFLIVISIGVPGGSMTLVKSVFFYIVMSLEAFIYCFVGEHLSTKSELIGDAVYESNWYELNPSQNRDVLLMILRSQKHLKLTIGKVADLSLKQFADIVKASASYVSVLHAMY